MKQIGNGYLNGRFKANLKIIMVSKYLKFIFESLQMEYIYTFSVYCVHDCDIYIHYMWTFLEMQCVSCR